MKFADIPQFTQSGSYTVDVDWHYLLEQVQRHQEDYGLNLDPDFQRAHVWSREQQIAWIEFVLRGGRSSRELLFNCVGWQSLNTLGEYVIVDGKQRITAALGFLHNEIPVFGGNYYKDFTDRIRSSRVGFKWTVNDLSTRKQVLQWYLELNTGGVVHTTEEIEKVRVMLEQEKHRD